MRRRTPLWLTTATTLEGAFTLRSLAQANLDVSNSDHVFSLLQYNE
jgi:hypothetical protein